MGLQINELEAVLRLAAFARLRSALLVRNLEDTDAGRTLDAMVKSAATETFLLSTAEHVTVAGEYLGMVDEQVRRMRAGLAADQGTANSNAPSVP